MFERLKFLGYEFVYTVVHITFTFLFSLRTAGRNNVPPSGPVLLLANHQSGLDPMLAGLVTRRHVTFLARKTLFKKGIIDWFFRLYDTVPIDQEGVAKEGLKHILDRLKRGQAVVVFPEGTRTSDGKMNPLKPGIQLLIRRAKPAIVPIGIAGAFHAWPHWRSYPLPSLLTGSNDRRAIAVCAGEPLDGKEYANMDRKELLDDLYQKIDHLVQRAESLRCKK